METTARVVAELVASDELVYGISTGFGALATTAIAATKRDDMQKALIRSHAAGMGPPVEGEVVRAMMLLRARSLALGFSGVRPVVARRIVELLNAGLTPVVPEYGSLGASGDLAPLAHCALALLGEGEVHGANGEPVHVEGPDEGSFVWQLIHTSPSGSLDTSFIATDYLNNPGTMNGVARCVTSPGTSWGNSSRSLGSIRKT